MSKSQKAGSTLVIVIGIVVAVIVIAGAGVATYFIAKDGDDSSSTAAKSDTVNKEDTKPIKQAPVKAMSLPAGYPKDAAPIYEPSTITMAMKVGKGWLVRVDTKDDIKDVAKSVLSTYKSLGAKVSQTPFNDEGVGQVAGGNAGYGIIATYSTDDEKNVTSISYHVDPQVKH